MLLLRQHSGSSVGNGVEGRQEAGTMGRVGRGNDDFVNEDKASGAREKVNTFK